MGRPRGIVTVPVGETGQTEVGGERVLARVVSLPLYLPSFRFSPGWDVPDPGCACRHHSGGILHYVEYTS